jgi:hypothetical protein
MLLTKLLVGLYLSFVCFNANCQVVFSFDATRVAYVGLENPITAMVAGKKCSEIILSVDNGSISQLENCTYYFKPDKAGVATFKISLKGNKKCLRSYTVAVKKPPPPTILMGKHIDGDSIPKKNILAQKGLTADISRSLGFIICDVNYLVDSFSLSVFRDAKQIYMSKNIGASFTEENKAFFSTLLPNDKIVLFDTHYSLYAKQDGVVKTIVFTVIE